MKVIEQLMKLSLIPILFCDLIGFFGSVIWLMILGKWAMLGYGILSLIFSTFIIGIALMPGLLLAVPAVSLLQRDNKLGGYFFGLLGTIYTVTIISIWCISILIAYTHNTDTKSFIPALFFSYCIATGPISWMAQKEAQGGNDNSAITTFFLKIAYILTILGLLVIEMTLYSVVVIFMIVMLISISIQFYAAYLDERNGFNY